MTRLLLPEEHESVVMAEVMLAIGGREDVRLFRNNRGIARRRRRDGGLGRSVEFGLTAGAADLIGFVAPTGRFLAIEAKSPTGRQSDDQRDFQEMVERFGGIYIITDSAADAVAQLDKRLALAMAVA
jgi:hypothetical protein